MTGLLVDGVEGRHGRHVGLQGCEQLRASTCRRRRLGCRVSPMELENCAAANDVDGSCAGWVCCRCTWFDKSLCSYFARARRAVSWVLCTHSAPALVASCWVWASMSCTACMLSASMRNFSVALGLARLKSNLRPAARDVVVGDGPRWYVVVGDGWLGACADTGSAKMLHRVLAVHQVKSGWM